MLAGGTSLEMARMLLTRGLFLQQQEWGEGSKAWEITGDRQGAVSTPAGPWGLSNRVSHKYVWMLFCLPGKSLKVCMMSSGLREEILVHGAQPGGHGPLSKGGEVET